MTDRNDFGQTPFLEACWHGQVETAEEILAESADVLKDRDTKRDQTALHIVCVRLMENFYELSHMRYWRLLKFLLSNGVDINAQDKFGCTALHYLFLSKVRTEFLLNEIELIINKKPNLLLENNQKRSIARDFPLFQKYFTYCDKLGGYKRIVSTPTNEHDQKITILKKK